MMLVELSVDDIERLIKCRKTAQRGFSEWNLNSLIHQAILEFYEKYGDEK